jgi:hypothetical protein
MDWVILSSGMMICVAANSLIVRKLLVKGVPGALINFINFFGCFIFYSLYGILSGRQFGLPLFDLATIVSMSILFNYVGNVLCMQSIACAPNPGYGLVIIKSNVIMVALFSALFLGSALPIKNILAIIAGLLFLALVVKSERGGIKGKASHNWILPSIGTFFCFGFLTLATKYLLLRGIDTLLILFYSCGILSMLFYWDAIKTKEQSVAAVKSWWMIIFFAAGIVFSVAGNLWKVDAIRLAPNPGYVHAIEAASNVLIVLGAVWLFKDHLSAVKLIGIVGVIASLVVLLV